MAITGLWRIEEDLFNVRLYLIRNEEIQKLIYYTGSDALSKDTPPFDSVYKHIFVTPVFDTTKEPFNKTTFISIIVPETEWDDEDQAHLATIRINVFSKIENWTLDDNKIRVFQIISRIIEMFDGKKLESSHKLFYLSSDLTTLNETYAGYTVLFGVRDGGGEDVELY